MRCHCVSSRFWPSLSVNFSVVARLTVDTAVPPAVKRISASRPRLPTRIALFTLPIVVGPFSGSCETRDRSLDGVEALLRERHHADVIREVLDDVLEVLL